MNEALQLIAWICVFASIASGIMYLLTILVSRDTTAYDMEFVWDGKYTLEELELQGSHHLRKQLIRDAKK